MSGGGIQHVNSDEHGDIFTIKTDDGILDDIWWRWKQGPDGSQRLHTHLDSGQYAWIAKITGSSDQFLFERRFLGHTEYQGADGKDHPIYKGEIIEVVKQSANIRKYFKCTEDNGWEEISEKTVKENFSGSTPMGGEEYFCWECDMTYHKEDMTKRNSYGYICDDCQSDTTQLTPDEK